MKNKKMKVNAPSNGHLAKMQNRKSSRIKLDYLTDSELAEFEKVGTTPGTTMDVHKDMFVFSSYVGGLRLSDMAQLRWSYFDGKKINFIRMKTNGQLCIPVPNKGLEILNKYRTEETNPATFIFNTICSAPAHINKNVNAVAKLAGIDRDINFRFSRNTFATMAVTKGMSIETLSKIMGYSFKGQTLVYLKIDNSVLDNAMDMFNDK